MHDWGYVSNAFNIIKDNVPKDTPWRHVEQLEVKSHAFLISTLEEGERALATLGCPLGVQIQSGCGVGRSVLAKPRNEQHKDKREICVSYDGKIKLSSYKLKCFQSWKKKYR